MALVLRHKVLFVITSHQAVHDAQMLWEKQKITQHLWSYDLMALYLDV